jgi:D-beta-D-heptose 7-phosphate kinase / D-beta-D-heptose 1-phosphate adenosyltransferase
MLQSNFSAVSVLIIGDLILDKYYYGKVNRISPEAPIPIVKVTGNKFSPGGAANVAKNITHLKATAYLVGITGKDENKDILSDLLVRSNVKPILTETDEPTITKMRIIGEHQQIVRLDFEEIKEPENKIIEKIKKDIQDIIEKVNIVVISDYGKGICTFELCQFVFKIAAQKNIPVIVDPKGKQWDKYNGATMITPNLKELGEVVGKDLKNEDEEVVDNGLIVLNNYRINNLLVTRSEKGMTLITKEQAVHMSTEAKEVYDVSGAGDTVIATLSVALASGMTLKDATTVSNKAAGIVVSKFGTEPIEYDELNRDLTLNQNQKVVTLDYLTGIVNDLKYKQKKVVFTNGCFDILHRGHVSYLNEAKKLGDILIVGLNSDTSVKLLKGDDRPLNHENDRAFILSNLKSVDYVILFNEETPYQLIKAIKPDILVKGGDYQIHEVVGREFAGRTIILPFVEGYSTTQLIHKVKDH